MADVIDTLLATMTFAEKVGQLNQRLLGWNAIERRGSRLVATDELKAEIDRWGGLGVLYGLFRADPWSGRSWADGIRPEERGEAAALLQSTVLERGAHGIGALLSEEAPHGHQALGGTVLPVNLALGATFDPAAVREAERAVARELFESGVHLALVSGLDIARDPRWGRCEECFGEDPHMVAEFCRAIVEGMQGVDRALVGRGGVAVVLKHLAAQGEAVGGRNGQSAVIGEHDLHEIHLPPVVAGAKAGAWGFMAAYNDIDAVPCCANPWLLKDYLRAELGFDGIVMADGLAVDRLQSMTGSIPAAGRAALLAGVDVSLWDEGFASLAEHGADDPEVVVAVDRSVRRVLELKGRFGLLPTIAENSADAASRDAVRLLPARIPTPDAGRIEAAIEAARPHARRLAGEALVLLKNERATLPLNIAALAKGPLIVTGPFAGDMACFLGDYTAPLRPEEITGVGRELTRVLGERARVVVAPDPADVLEKDWRNASAVVLVVGGTSERSYDSAFADNGAAAAVAEHGATGGEGVDAADISLPWGQDELAGRIAALTDAPIVAVVVAGRAHVFTETMRYAKAVVWAGYAGPAGPAALADALLGRAPMPGRMPVTVPSAPGAVPVRYNDRQSACDVYRDAPDPVLVSFGTGLGSLPGVSVDSLEATVVDGSIRVRAELRAGSEDVHGSVGLYLHRTGGTCVPRLSELVGNAYVSIEAGCGRVLHWNLPAPQTGGMEFRVGERICAIRVSSC